MSETSHWDSEPPQIRARDWRLQAITTLSAPYSSPTGITHAAGTQVQAVGFLQVGGQTLDIALPSPIALYMGMATDAELIARKHLRQAIPRGLRDPRGTQPNMTKRESPLFDGIQHRAAAIIFSHTALEAFANESLPIPFTYRRNHPRTREPQVLDRAGVERFVQLGEKLDSILPEIYRVPSPRGTRLWQAFRWIAGMRDRLVHLKEDDWRRLGPDEARRFVWNHLIRKPAHLAPWHVRNLLAHYYANGEPRWLRKYTQRFGDRLQSEAI